MATVRRVLAANPGPYTGPGTNTWILGDSPVALVIDPGPDDDDHLEAIQDRLGDTALGGVLLTHGHPDHAPGADRLAASYRARVMGWPELADGDVVRAGALEVVAVHTPGHAPDHLCFWLPADRVVFSGDLVLGQGSSTVAYPEGDMADFLGSLQRLLDLNPRMLFPGHWDPPQDARARIEECRRHRLDREEQVLKELTTGPGNLEELTRRVYGGEGVGEDLRSAAELTLLAHLRKLEAEGRVAERAVNGGQVWLLT